MWLSLLSAAMNHRIDIHVSEVDPYKPLAIAHSPTSQASPAQLPYQLKVSYSSQTAAYPHSRCVTVCLFVSTEPATLTREGTDGDDACVELRTPQ